MTPEFSIPLFLALAALFTADYEKQIFLIAFRKSLSLGKREGIEAKLSKIGRSEDSDFENFRIYQLFLIASGIVILTLLFSLNLVSALRYLILVIFAVILVPIATERRLTKRYEARSNQIEQEFPAIVEMLTLAVGAGESPVSAIRKISLRANGQLAQELRFVVGKVEEGRSFASVLDEFSRRIDSDQIRRFVDSLVISLSRGTSLFDTLNHSAQEARNKEKNLLLAKAGKSDILMMIPVIFLILPISILFALYPSLTNLNLYSF